MTLRRLRLALALALVASTAVARAQDEALDADPRPYDKVWISGIDAPIDGTIVSGAEPDAAVIKIKKKGETITTEFDRGKVTKILPRQTPADAFKDRADRIKSGPADDHHKLGDWAWKVGLETEALAEMQKAIAASSGQASVPHRARLARLLLLKRQKVEKTARDAVDEDLETLWQKTEKASAQSPEVELGRARALLEQGLAPLALASLEKARAALAKQATEGTAPPEPAASPSPSPSASPTPSPSPTGTKKGDKDGALPRGDKPDPSPTPEAPAPVDDKSAEKWPGLTAAQRELYRFVLLAQAEGLLQAGRPGEVGAALAALFEAYPQDRQAVALSAEAKLLSGDPKGAIEDWNRVIAVAPQDATLLRDRGIANYAAGQLDAAKDDLERAIQIGLEDPRPARAHLGLVLLRQGKWKAAAIALDAANQPTEFAPAKLGLALLAELQGKPGDAAALLDAARALSDQLGIVDLGLAQAREREEKHDEARTLLRQAVTEGLPFPVGARWLAAVARSRGDAREELRTLEELVGSTDDPSPDDLYALGRAYLGAERLDDARGAFEKALAKDPKHVASLLGQGFVLYRQDDRESARTSFQQALALDKTNAYAQRGLKNLLDARTRRVWVDRFDRDTAEVENGWIAEQSMGVAIALKDHKVQFQGTQAREDLGKTRLFRDVPNQQVVRLEMRLDLTAAADARCGISFETDKGSAIFFRDQDNALEVSYSSAGGIGSAVFQDPVKVGAWPTDARSHTLAIEIEAPDTGFVSFWLDDQRVADTKIASIGRASKTQLAVYGKAKTGSTYSLGVEEVRIYARRADVPSGPKGGGF